MLRAMRLSYENIARLIRPGEWTSYGDISAAVHGSSRAARAVGRTAATSDEFPNAHRVLRSDGSISRGTGPCASGVLTARERLEREGIAFDRRGRADPGRKVEWDELARRAGSEPRSKVKRAERGRSKPAPLG